MADILPVADVLWWNERDVRVRCPFCAKSHRHGMVGSDERYQTDSTRVAHCPPLLSPSQHQYRICFPVDTETQGVAYEIDKEKRRFQTIGIQQDPEHDESVVEVFEPELKLTANNDPLNSFASGTEMTTFQTDGDEGQYDSVRLIDLALLDCISGRTPEVIRFLDTSKDSQRLIRGTDDIGNTALSLAAAQVHPRMVSLLLDRGADVNNRNNQGRTPLMEAALWGRTENAKLLLQNNADKAIKDRSGYIASDFAAPHTRNSEERSKQAGVHKEDTFEADKQRKVIAIMLRDQPEKSSISFAPSNSQEDDTSFSSFQKSPQTSSFKFCAPTADIIVSSQSKTVGRLERRHPFPPMYAVSGYKHAYDDLVIISGEKWTEEVFRICRLVQYELPTRSWDSGPPGSYYASHAEKQLIAYFLSKHVFLEDEVTDENLETSISNLDALALAGAPSKTTTLGSKPTERNLQSLYLAQPPVSLRLRKATILVSSEVCENCRAFVKKVEASYGLTIRLRRC